MKCVGVKVSCKLKTEKVMDDLDDVVKRYTEECVSLLAESVQKHLKDLQEENAKLKEENVALQRKAAFFCRMSLM